MLRLKRLIHHVKSISPAIPCRRIITHEQDKLVSLISPHFAQWSPNRSIFDFYGLPSKAKNKKQRSRLADEMKRGRFVDAIEFKKHGGKIVTASKTIIPALEAVRFPALEVTFSDGKTLKLPIISDRQADNAENMPKASLICLTFRAMSNEMINTWCVPFLDTFSASKNVQLYKVSFIEQPILCWRPVKRLLLWMIRNSNGDVKSGALESSFVYFFGDHYWFRKELKLENLITGYVFLVDEFGRIRWQGSGSATEEELAALLSCTTLLLEEK
uniref:AT1G08220-like protein n=1 Tax=Pelargonium transvaalense TaxID=158603 RepID=A0A0G4AN72_9ROSI|nr:AT1G08220-like protein [Pelargonium transvaalense]